jgi:hypothetical protein
MVRLCAHRRVAFRIAGQDERSEGTPELPESVEEVVAPTVLAARPGLNQDSWNEPPRR